MEKFRTEVIGDATLILGDCSEVLPTLQDIGAVVSDPPYGMAWNTDSTRFSRGKSENNRHRGQGRADWGDVQGDNVPFDPSPWLEYESVVLWGANHYAQRLPVGKTLVWLKKPPALFGTFLSDCEIGWAKGGYGVFAHYRQFPTPTRMVEAGGDCAHPTQKPVSLMTWCLEQFARRGTVLDPFMGSGTTGVACLQTGRKFIGVELDPTHYEAAVRRIEAAHKQPRLFEEPIPKPEQISLFGSSPTSQD